MAKKTLTQQVEELAERVKDQSTADNFRFNDLEEAFDDLKRRVEELEDIARHVEGLQRRADKLETMPETAARHDERLKSLEKWHDRAFQVAPMVISAFGVLVSIVSVVIAFTKK